MSAAEAAIRHSDVSLNTYVDFANNNGRYVTGVTNAMLDHIRQRDGGVKIEYTGGQTANTLPHGMLSFDSVVDMGNATLVNYNYVVTVKHNTTLNPTFGANKYGVGVDKTIVYKGIEEEGTGNHFVLDAPTADYKLVRLSKLATDAVSTTLHHPTVVNGKTDMTKQQVYRVGGGEHWWKDYEGQNKLVVSAGGFNLGGVGTIHSWEDKTGMANPEDYKYAVIKGKESWAKDGFSSETPLPFGSMGGDSGSPYFVWNDNESRFELLMAHTGSYNNGEMMVGQAAPRWSQDTMDKYNVYVDMSRTDGTIQIGGIEPPDGEESSIRDGIKGEGASTATQITVTPSYGYLYQGSGRTVTDEGGNAVRYAGVQSGNAGVEGDMDIHTWKSLSDLKDKDTWYTYGNDRLNATASVVLQDKEHVPADGLTYARLYTTQNLVFKAEKDNETYSVKVNADTDLGVGYVRFTAEKCSGIVFNVESEKNYLLNSAGYVVDAGVTVNVKLRNTDAEYMREWRKVGEGTLNICGSDGNNEIFLNVGGEGRTLLNQKKGYYAAYNVLVNTGSTVVISDIGQIARDLTFANGGGTLDMNGNSMDWYTSGGQTRDGFTIQALTEEALVANYYDKSVLSFKQDGNQTFVGSFADSDKSSLMVDYQGGGTLTLNSIRTKLSNADSGLTVSNGTVKLAGTLTVHGLGSLVDENGAPIYDSNTNALFSTRENDWHYADAAMNVTVKDKATFELESHARLTGTVTVESGGTYVMHEGVQLAEEYIEGGERMEKTAELAEYFGHKGDVKLAEGAEMQVVFSSGTDTELRYSGNISGPGSLIIALGSDKAALALEGNISGLAELTVKNNSSVCVSGSLDVDVLEVEVGSELLVQSSAELAAALTSSSGQEIVADESLTLTRFGGEDTLVLQQGSCGLQVVSSLLNDVTLSAGSALSLDLSALGDVSGYEYICVEFSGKLRSSSPLSLSEQATVTATLEDGSSLVGYYAADNNGTVYFAAVPEPATGTLTLLALSLLCARRRSRRL